MSGFLLTQAERDRFAAWCEREAQSDEQMATQWEKMSNQLNPHDALVKRLRAEAAAKKVVARVLRSIESEEIST